MTIRFSLLSLVVGATFLAAQKTPDQALATLREGNARFAAGQSVAPPLGPGFRRSLARGQSPYAIVVCCADSRVPPEHVFNAGLGDLFVIRVAGNSCDPDTLASIEYAAEHLATPLCVVLGHESCGAVGACIAELQGHYRPESNALAALLEHLQPSVQKALAENLGGKQLSQRAEEENAQATALDCLRRSPVLQQLLRLQRFRIVPARYHLDSGAVEWLPERPLIAEPPPAPHTEAPAMGLPPHAALQLLQAGHRRFLSAAPPTGDISAHRRDDLTQGQHPLAIVVTCSDSRVPPEHIFDAGLGELFVIRVAGNVLADETLASIEYAAAHTGASLLVVMGHSGCGAVTAAAAPHDDAPLSSSMRGLLAKLEPAVERARQGGRDGAGLVDRAVHLNVLRTLQQARAQSVLLRELEHDGRFAMVPAVYDLATGDIEWMKDESAPAPAAEPHAAPMGETAPPHEGGHEEAPHHEAPAPRTPPHEDTADEPHRPYATAAAAADASAPAPHAAAATAPLLPFDPSLLLGGLGMGSLVVASFLVLRRRS